MSIDLLQTKIRKLKNPSMVDFAICPGQLPPQLLEQEGTPCLAYERFCKELLEALRETVPAVRFSFSSLALLGANGLGALSRTLKLANDLGYFVALGSPEILSPWDADRIAAAIFGSDEYPCHALIVSPYIGTDALKPFVHYCKEGDKTVFAAVRTPNKSSQEIQDLLTGSRLVHIAAMDIVTRSGDGIYGKCGYSQISACVSATSATSVSSIRKKYDRAFLLVDGVDYPNGNYKNCTGAFDRFGHGGVVCAGPSVTAAWLQEEGDYVELARQAAERMKKNITRYVTVL